MQVTDILPPTRPHAYSPSVQAPNERLWLTAMSAETIAAHQLEAGGVEIVDHRYFRSLASGDVDEEEQFPFAAGTLNGAKCCTKCGATKTPQWREGPFGEQRSSVGSAPRACGWRGAPLPSPTHLPPPPPRRASCGW